MSLLTRILLNALVDLIAAFVECFGTPMMFDEPPIITLRDIFEFFAGSLFMSLMLEYDDV